MTKICPNCQHENPIIAPYCNKCKTLLPEAPTEIVDIKDSTDELRRRAESQRIEAPPNALTLLIPPEQSPLVKNIQDGDRLILGRASSETPDPTIDLTSFGAIALGVSREHAAIKFSGSECSVTDLGSSNGTWLNENRLEAHKVQTLRNGDMLRLGNMLVFTYFSSKPDSTDTIILGEKARRYASDTQYRLTPIYLAEKVAPFMNAIFDIQAQIDYLLEVQSAGPEVEFISVSDRQSGIEVRLRGTTETVGFLNEKIYPKNVQRQTGGDVPVTTVIKEDALPPPAVPPKEPPKLPESWDRLCDEFLAEIAPNVSEERRASYQEKILRCLATLAGSGLEILNTGK